MGHNTIQTNLLNDLTFKKLFVSEETKHITLHFLQDVIKLNVSQIELKPSEVYSAKKLSDLANKMIWNARALTCSFTLTISKWSL